MYHFMKLNTSYNIYLLLLMDKEHGYRYVALITLPFA